MPSFQKSCYKRGKIWLLKNEVWKKKDLELFWVISWVLDGGPIEILRKFIGCKPINNRGCEKASYIHIDKPSFNVGHCQKITI